MAKSDPMLARIRAFDRAKGGGVAVERASKGYSLFSVETGAPIARLRPTGSDDEVEILWWRHGRWGSIGDFGGGGFTELTLGLPEGPGRGAHRGRPCPIIPPPARPAAGQR